MPSEEMERKLGAVGGCDPSADHASVVRVAYLETHGGVRTKRDEERNRSRQRDGPTDTGPGQKARSPAGLGGEGRSSKRHLLPHHLPVRELLEGLVLCVP